MVDRGVKELRRDPLPALIRCDDEADDRADVRGAIARDVDQLRLRRGMAPPDDTPKAIRDEPVRLRRVKSSLRDARFCALVRSS